MKVYRFFLISALFLTFTSLTVVAQENNTEKVEDIKLLLQLTNSSQVTAKIMNPLIDSFKERFSDVPVHFWDDFIEDTEYDIAKVMEPLITVYDNHFSHDEIKKLINLYNSELGRKITAVQPLIVKENDLLNEKCGKLVLDNILTKLKGIGYNDTIMIKRAMPAADLEDGKTTTFTIVVEYTLISKDQGEIKVGFNNGSKPNSYRMVESEIIACGTGEHTFAVTANAKDWGDRDNFRVYVNLSEYPHERSWTPMFSDQQILSFK